MSKTKNNSPIMAIEAVLENRYRRGATDEQLIRYLESLKAGTWKNDEYMKKALDGFIDAIRQTGRSAHKFNKRP